MPSSVSARPNNAATRVAVASSSAPAARGSASGARPLLLPLRRGAGKDHPASAASRSRATPRGKREAAERGRRATRGVSKARRLLMQRSSAVGEVSSTACRRSIDDGVVPLIIDEPQFAILNLRSSSLRPPAILPAMPKTKEQYFQQIADAGVVAVIRRSRRTS